MRVFVRNIPKNTLSKELVHFFNPALKGHLFNESGKVTDVQILALRDRNTKLVEYHAVVTIQPDKAAVRAIKKLHGKHFKNQRIAVREFVFRKEPKDVNMDRRRNMELIEHYVPQYSSTKGFHRLY